MGFAEPHGHGGRASEIRGVVASTPNVQLPIPVSPCYVEVKAVLGPRFVHIRGRRPGRLAPLSIIPRRAFSLTRSTSTTAATPSRTRTRLS